jgi:inositol 3-alpha-galactosyltransferase
MMAEQALLNWQFGIDGAFPASSLAHEYEKGLLKVVHEKLWVGQWAWLQEEWESGWSEILGFYRGLEFTEESERR